MSNLKGQRQSGRQSTRNILVENAVCNALKRIDDFISGEKVTLPSSSYRRACEDLLASEQRGAGGKKRGSRRAAALFFTFYRLEHPDWDLD